MDPWHDVGDVAHVGAPRDPGSLLGRAQRGSAQVDDGLAVRLRQPVVRTQLRVHRGDLGGLVPSPGRDGTGPEAVLDTTAQTSQRFHLWCPQVEHRGGPGGHDVGRRTAVRHDTVDLLAGFQMLTSEPDGDLRDGEGVRGVDPALGSRGRVRLPSRVAHLQVRDGPTGAGHRLLGSRVHHQRQGDRVEDAPLQHQHLAPSDLLSGGTDDEDGDAELVGDVPEAERRPDCRRRDHVVPAGVPDLGQGVVLGAQPDDEVAVPEARGERRVQPRDGATHLETLVGEHRRDLADALVLGEGQLGLGVDTV